uniref:U8-Deinotoxin-Dsu1c_1 n=4 Tax=Deinopis subrufa TaxID=1905329 RepID=A0A4Q8KBE9_DEISU
MKLYIQALFLCVALFVYVAAEAEEREVEDENELEFLAPQEERGCKGVMSPCKEDSDCCKKYRCLCGKTGFFSCKYRCSCRDSEPGRSIGIMILNK